MQGMQGIQGMFYDDDNDDDDDDDDGDDGDDDDDDDDDDQIGFSNKHCTPYPLLPGVIFSIHTRYRLKLTEICLKESC